MSGHVAFPLSDGQILTIRVAQEPGEMRLEQVRDGSILWGFDTFLGDRAAKNKYCEDILAWPYRNKVKLQSVRLEVGAVDRQQRSGVQWLGESFGLACAIAFNSHGSDAKG